MQGQRSGPEYFAMHNIFELVDMHTLQFSQYCIQLLLPAMLVLLGPNFVWHADGMDKLKPHGFAIHDDYKNKILTCSGHLLCDGFQLL